MRNAGNELFEEDFATIDGNFAADRPLASYNLLAIRHDRLKRQRDDAPGTFPPNPEHRGNVAFVDGHAEYVPRNDAHNRMHYLPGQ